MKHFATILTANFHPMVDLVPSIFEYTVKLENGHEMNFRDEGSIPYLSGRFGFKILGEHEWDLSDTIGAKCIILENKTGYSFIALQKNIK